MSLLCGKIQFFVLLCIYLLLIECPLCAKSSYTYVLCAVALVPGHNHIRYKYIITFNSHSKPILHMRKIRCGEAKCIRRSWDVRPLLTAVKELSWAPPPPALLWHWHLFLFSWLMLLWLFLFSLLLNAGCYGLNWVLPPPNSYVKFLTPSTSGCDFI